MDIDTKLQGNGALSYSLKSTIYILFNPWCPGKALENLSENASISVTRSAPSQSRRQARGKGFKGRPTVHKEKKIIFSDG